MCFYFIGCIRFKKFEVNLLVHAYTTIVFSNPLADGIKRRQYINAKSYPTSLPNFEKLPKKKLNT